MRLTQRVPATRRCPYCRDDLDVGLCTFCSGCNTLYHQDCANELGECATLGCSHRVRERVELPITGVTSPTFNPPRVLLAQLVLAFLAFLLPLWLMASRGADFDAAFGMLVALGTIAGLRWAVQRE